MKLGQKEAVEGFFPSTLGAWTILREKPTLNFPSYFLSYILNYMASGRYSSIFSLASVKLLSASYAALKNS